MHIYYLLSLVATAMEMTVCLLCTRYLLLLQRENLDRSRRLLACGSLASGLLALFIVAGNIAGLGSGETIPVLNPWIGLVYMIMNIIMVLYPLSVLRPDWLTPRHATWLFLPTLILPLLFLFFIGRWTPLQTPAQIWSHLGSPDVLARLAPLLLMLPYCFLLFLLPYNYRQTSGYFWWILRYSSGLLGICLVHIALMLTNNPILLILLPLMAASFYIFSTEYELEERLRPGQKEDESLAPTPTPAAAPEEEITIWERVCQLMDQEEVWRDPDLSLTGMARQCATNVTYLNRAIQKETGGGFKELLNKKRVAFVVAQLEANPALDIQAAFFNAGYRSRTTAWRNFKEITGQSPADFKQGLK